MQKRFVKSNVWIVRIVSSKHSSLRCRDTQPCISSCLNKYWLSYEQTCIHYPDTQTQYTESLHLVTQHNTQISSAYTTFPKPWQMKCSCVSVSIHQSLSFLSSAPSSPSPLQFRSKEEKGEVHREVLSVSIQSGETLKSHFSTIFLFPFLHFHPFSSVPFFPSLFITLSLFFLSERYLEGTYCC